jgi:hypothetical protein
VTSEPTNSNPIDDELQRLQRAYPIPAGGELLEVFSERSEICGISVSMVGLVAQVAEAPAVPGSAAGLDDLPVERAYYELLERLSLVLAKTRGAESYQARDEHGDLDGKITRSQVFPDSTTPLQRHAISNGAALHSSWQAARVAAYAELVERDAALRCWYGQQLPQRLRIAQRLGTLAQSYDLVTALVDGQPEVGGAEPRVAMCVGFPKSAEAPLLRGLSAKPSTAEAVDDAVREALQSLCFLWGEALPSVPPEPQASPDYHQEYYLLRDHHQPLRRWLDGKGPKTDVQLPAFDPRATRFVDLTPEELEGKLWVCKAINPTARPLLFGPQRELSGHPLGRELWVHPIP